MTIVFFVHTLQLFGMSQWMTQEEVPITFHHCILWEEIQKFNCDGTVIKGL
jgi:hypothetical protein